jgi:hypothetical protein
MTSGHIKYAIGMQIIMNQLQERISHESDDLVRATMRNFLAKVNMLQRSRTSDGLSRWSKAE